jgi:hypothetical protein
MRPILILAVIIISHIGGYHCSQPCDKVAFMLGGEDNAISLYPACAPLAGLNTMKYVSVEATLFGDKAQLAAVFNVAAGMSAWLALAIHAIGIEFYVSRCGSLNRIPLTLSA